MKDAPYKVSGKRSGPPPLRGPNPQVPPVKLSSGGEGNKKKPIMQVVVQGLRSPAQIAKDLVEKKRKNKLKAKEMRTGQGYFKFKDGGEMVCPHRPDGVRGAGAAIKGMKFTGVK
jgi:hypothetical protein